MEFRVRLTPPPGADAARLRTYVEDAVATWRGSYDPNDPIFDLDPDTVVASHVFKPIDTVRQARSEISRLTVEITTLRRRLLDCEGREAAAVEEDEAEPELEPEEERAERLLQS